MRRGEGHAARMDGVYREQRHIYDLTRKYYLLGRDRLIDELMPPVGGRVLEIGCGTGRNLIAAARCWPGARFYGVDISGEMLKTARASIARAGLAKRIRVAEGDATDFDPNALFRADGFDRIFQSYTLSMIPDWQGAMREATRHLAPYGSLHIVDFGQQEELPAWWRGVLLGWLARFHVEPRAMLVEAAREVANDIGGRMSVTRLYRGYTWSVRIDRRPH
ncbi:class I SAM-dependent methyltransferase [Sphingopyxis sp.]|uniref:class I SAM-dependent methyltransferase n=1 Tax=Sphingopyxis sp. TaxID=1908224 RepID=UPI002D77F970|nr:class I SAM-dependent methyltransferase [Sphingopyxis sp.]HET6526183.1 class I SAM-dependent methyltransferase [Sphingopyxis sp.]